MIPKIGQISTWGTKRPFKDFLVQGQWIMNWLQAEKITTTVARIYLLKSCHNVSRTLQELEIIERERERVLIQCSMAAASVELKRGQRSFRVIPQVVEWERQYIQVLYRYCFLVLEGPSKMGKTQYAKSLCPEGKEVLEVNCAAGGDPNLRDYRYSKHGLVLLDEIKADTIANQRKMFQCGPTEVQLGTSATNSFSYSVYLFRIRLVLCTNHWHSSMAALPQEDRDWISANSVVVECRTHLYVDEA